MKNGAKRKEKSDISTPSFASSLSICVHRRDTSDFSPQAIKSGSFHLFCITKLYHFSFLCFSASKNQYYFFIFPSFLQIFHAIYFCLTIYLSRFLSSNRVDLRANSHTFAWGVGNLKYNNQFAQKRHENLGKKWRSLIFWGFGCCNGGPGFILRKLKIYSLALNFDEDSFFLFYSLKSCFNPSTIPFFKALIPFL